MPIALFLQFTKVVNCFYVVNTVLQLMPSISTNDPIYASMVLMILIVIGMLKEGLADWKRYKTDKQSNSQHTERLTGRISLIDEPKKKFTPLDNLNDSRQVNLAMMQ